MIEINTNKIKEYGNDIIILSKNLNELLQDLYSRINNISRENGEWHGEGANLFISRANKDKLELLKLKNKIYNSGVLLNNNANNYEKVIKKMSGGYVISDFRFDNFKIKNLKEDLVLGLNSIKSINYNVGVLEVPKSFEYLNYLQKIVNDNENICEVLNRSIKFLDQSIYEYENIITENISNAIRIDNI